MTDLFANTEFKPHIPSRLPRFPRVKGCAADLATEGERNQFHSRLARHTEIAGVRDTVLAHRGKLGEQRAVIRSLVKKRAMIKSRSKEAKAERELLTVEINKERAVLTLITSEGK